MNVATLARRPLGLSGIEMPVLGVGAWMMGKYADRAGRRAARGMKGFLGLRDTDFVYQERPDGAAATLFGIDRAERGYARVRLPR